MRNLVLASTSPRRSQLLEEAGLSFAVDAPQDVDEWDATSHPDLSPSDLAQLNAGRKAQEVSMRFPDALVLGADTVVSCSGRILGKPRDLMEAQEMLSWLSGKTHEVLTGVSFVRRDIRKCTECVVRSWVTFRTLDESAIVRYIQAVPVLDKAGAYGIQEKGELLIERMEGSRSNVMGLPMETVLKFIKTLS